MTRQSWTWPLRLFSAVAPLAALLMLAPVLAVIVHGLAPSGDEPYFAAWHRIWSNERFVSAAAHTVAYSIIVAALALVVTVPATIAGQLYSTNWSHALDACSAITYALPASGIALALLTLYVGNTDHPMDRSVLFVGALVALHYPVVHRSLSASLRAMNLSDLVAASRLLGCSDYRLVRRVLLPSAIRPLASCGGLIVLAVSSELAMASLILGPRETSLQPILNAMRAASGRETAMGMTLLLGITGLAIGVSHLLGRRIRRA